MGVLLSVDRRTVVKKIGSMREKNVAVESVHMEKRRLIRQEVDTSSPADGR
jgi:hypothetical protein